MFFIYICRAGSMSFDLRRGIEEEDGHREVEELVNNTTEQSGGVKSVDVQQ